MVAWWNTLHETPLDACVDLHLQDHETLAKNVLVHTLANNLPQSQDIEYTKVDTQHLV